MATFDTLKLSEGFVAVGFDEKKAKALAETFGELANNQLVTKEFLRNEMEKLESKMEKLELHLTIKMAIIITAVLTFFKAIETLF